MVELNQLIEILYKSTKISCNKYTIRMTIHLIHQKIIVSLQDPTSSNCDYANHLARLL